MKFRNGLLALCAVVAAGCGREQGAVSQQAQATLAPVRMSGAALVMASPAGADHQFARLPDRGELVAYHPDAVRRQGAYTWYRAEVSEAHALDAIGGLLRIVAPSGTPLTFRYDRHVEHPSGDWTWIGHIPGRPELQAILTFGAKAAFGQIGQPDGRPLRLTVQNGQSWLMATDARVLAGQINTFTRPEHSDALVVPRAMLRQGRAGAAQALAPIAQAAGTGAGTVDLVLGYTSGMVQMFGSDSAVQTRLNYLVDLTNQAYANSAIDAQVRLVKTVAVNYTELNNNDVALEQLSGYHSGSGGSDPSKWITPDPAFNALRAARETYGADLVSLVRRFQDPEQTSCGVAWLLGGGKQGITAGDGWDQLGYSVVSDTNGNGTGSFPDNGYICEDHTLAHELGHNMGSAHDRVTAQGSDGVLNDPGDYGAYAYSFGFKSKVSGANFYTIMAYGDRGQTSYLVFSNPRITFCGGNACGTTTFEDNARSLSQTIPVVSGFRPSAMTFADVPSGYWAYAAIDTVYNRGITGGCSTSPLLYCPTAPTHRDQMAVFLLRAKHGSSYQPPAATGVFADVPPSYWAAAWIEQAYREGITSGCSTSPRKYCPNSSVARDQMAVFLLRAEHGSAYQPPAAAGTYSDVPTSYWAAAWIEQLAREGVTGGCATSPPRYCPAAAVNRDQMAVFLVRTFGL